jgi:hypothetical protein
MQPELRMSLIGHPESFAVVRFFQAGRKSSKFDLARHICEAL